MTFQVVTLGARCRAASGGYTMSWNLSTFLRTKWLRAWQRPHCKTVLRRLPILESFEERNPPSSLLVNGVGNSATGGSPTTPGTGAVSTVRPAPAATPTTQAAKASTPAADNTHAVPTATNTAAAPVTDDPFADPLADPFGSKRHQPTAIPLAGRTRAAAAAPAVARPAALEEIAPAARLWPAPRRVGRCSAPPTPSERAVRQRRPPAQQPP